MRAEPGSPEFNRLLLARMESDPGIRSLGAPSIVQQVRYSRNTMIYRLAAGKERFVGKVQLTKPAEVVRAEYDVLVEMQRNLSAPGVRSLTPVALYVDLGVLVTKEAEGQPVRDFVDRGLQTPAGSAARHMAESLMEEAARALFAFHQAFRISRGPNGEPVSRRYLDFSPRNLLAHPRADGVATTLLDPPEYNEQGPVVLDLGTFCFDIGRASFMPQVFWRADRPWLDHLKWRFLKAYFGLLSQPVDPQQLFQVRQAEEMRGRQVLGWYRNFYRYRSWPKEFAKYAYFGPIVLLYMHFGLPRSFGRIEAAGR